MMHISPFKCSEGLFENAGAILQKNGLLITYGPYAENGQLTPESNISFDNGLRRSNPLWGVRDIVDLKKLAEAANLQLIEVHEMPANNKILIWKKL